VTRYGVPSETAGERLTRTLIEKDVSKTELARRLETLYGRKASSWCRQLVDWASDKKTIGDLNAYRVAQALGEPDDAFMTSRSRPTNLQLLGEAVTALQEQIDEFQTSVEDRLAALEVLLAPKEQP